MNGVNGQPRVQPMCGSVLFFPDGEELVALSQVKDPPRAVGQCAVVSLAHQCLEYRRAVFFVEQDCIAHGAPAPLAIRPLATIAVLGSKYSAHLQPIVLVDFARAR